MKGKAILFFILLLFLIISRLVKNTNLLTLNNEFFTSSLLKDIKPVKFYSVYGEDKFYLENFLYM